MKELARLDALAQAQLVKKGEISAVELTEAAIRRIEAVNPLLNLVVTYIFEQALDVARGPLPEGPLAGAPYLIKDFYATIAGVRHTEGTRFLKDWIAERDSELVRRCKAAGLIILGKTNTPEFGNASTVEPVLFGPSRNPWDLDRTVGGSSGGSAGAVAAGMTPMAHGNDGGGSIRIPASCCGVFGLKPTRARNPLGPDYGDIFCGLVAEHALTRSVRDSAALLDATSGPGSGDPYPAPPKERPFLDEVGADPGRLRIGFTTQAPTDVPVHPDCQKTVLKTARLCEDLGHVVEEASPELDGQKDSDAFFVLWSAGNAWMADTWSERTGRKPAPEYFEPVTWSLQEYGRSFNASQLLLTVQTLQQAARRIAGFFEEYDLWLTPTLAQPPVPIGHFDVPEDNPLKWIDLDAEFTPFCYWANVTGQPAMSVPLYWNKQGLPIGSHFVARFGQEATLFRLASQLEHARPWADRIPSVFASDRQ